jgi:uncharacterized membrane protein (DUF485 family)
MQEELYEKLQEMPEYQEFTRKNRFVSAISLLIIAGFLCIAFSTANVSDATYLGYLAIILLIAYVIIYSAYQNFFGNPKNIMRGEIVQIKTKEVYRRRQDRMRTSVRTLYLIRGNEGEYWTEAIDKKSHQVGERVISFIASGRSGYFVQDDEMR